MSSETSTEKLSTDKPSNVRPVDVQRTLEYASVVWTWRVLWIPAAILIGCVFVLMYDSRSMLQFQPWLGVILGAGWMLFALVRLIIPAKPMLVLSPRGMIWRNLTENLIPWSVIEDITITDHVASFRHTIITLGNVTVVWVPRRFYNRKIFVQSLFWRGPFWGNNFIHKDTSTGIVIVHELLNLPADQLHAEIVARWNAFKGQPAAASVPPAGQPTAPATRSALGTTFRREAKAARSEVLADHKTFWNDATVGAAFLLVLTFAGAVFYLIASSVSGERHRTRQDVGIAQMERKWNEDRVRTEAEMKRSFQEMDDRWRKNAPWMFHDDPAKKAEQPRAEGHRSEIMSLAVVPDGKGFLTGGADRSIKLWERDNPLALRDVGEHKGIVRSLHLLPGEQVLSAGDDGQIVLRKLADGEVLHVFEAAGRGGLHAMAVSRDGRRAVSMHWGGTGLVWDIEAKTAPRVLSGVTVRQSSVAISPDGAKAVSGGTDGMLRLWDTATGELLRTFGGHRGQIYGLAFTPDNRHVVSAGDDSLLRLWFLDNFQEVRSFSGHTGTAYSVAVSADGTQMLSGSNDRTARLWDLYTGQELARFTGHSSSAYVVAFTEDGQVLTASADRSIRLWRPSGTLVRIFLGSKT